MTHVVMAVTKSIFGNNLSFAKQDRVHLLMCRSPSGICTGHMRNLQRKRQLPVSHEERRRAPKQRWPADPCCLPGLCHRVWGRDWPPAFVTVMPAREPKTRTSALHTTAGPNARTSTSIVSPTTCKSVVAGLSPRSRDDTALAGLRNENEGGGYRGGFGADQAAARP